MRNTFAFALGLATCLFDVSARADDPGTESLVRASTDVAVVKVLATNPVKAIEGGRDHAQLRVIQTLKGQLGTNDLVSMYYHLNWSSLHPFRVEPRLDTNKDYVVFLIKGIEQEYVLTDNWLGIQNPLPWFVQAVLRIEKSKNSSNKVMQVDGAAAPRPDR